MVSFLILVAERVVQEAHKCWALLWLVWITFFSFASTSM